MASFQAFDKETTNWLKGYMALVCLKKRLNPFIDEEIEVFFQKLRVECGANPCEKNCNFNNWKPRLNQSPPLNCEVCSSWRDVILDNHTSGEVMWKNSKPNLWSKDKWEVAKVYMPDGQNDNKSIARFGIAALLCLMNQCKHFDKFKLGGLCDDVANVQNNISRSASSQLETEDLLDYFNRIKKLGQVLEKHVPDFKSLSKDIDEIAPSVYGSLSDNMAAQKSQAQDEKQLDDIFFSKMATPFEVFLHILEDLGAEEFKIFKWWLRNEDCLEGFAAIRRCRLENANRQEIVDHMVNHYGKNTFKVIRIVLKQMNRNDLVEKLPRIISKPEGVPPPKSKDLQYELNSRSGSIFQNLQYELNSRPTGLCVIINNKKFVPERRGTDKDAESLAKVFSWLGFRALMCRDQTKDQMERALKCFSSLSDLAQLREFNVEEWSGNAFTALQEAPRHGDAFICCILSHGDKGVVSGVDFEPLSLKEITRTFTLTDQSALAGKPKVFLIQACQGPKIQRGVLSDDLQADDSCSPSDPEHADVLVAVATVEDHKAWRDKTKGSWFIQTVCEQLKEGCQRSEDIVTILHRVNNEVSQKEGNSQPGAVKQMPEVRFTFRKRLVLSPC